MRKILFSTAVSVLAATQAAEAQVIPAVPNAVLSPQPKPVPVPNAPAITEELALPETEITSVDIRGVRITGARVIPEAEIAKLFAPLVGGTAQTSDLQRALSWVAALYEKSGYALGRAYAPAQQMRDGILQIRIVEGFIGGVIVQTDSPRMKDTIAGYVAPLLNSKPLRTRDLDRILRLMADIPGAKINSRLTDLNLSTGAAALVLEVQYSPVSFSLALDTRSRRNLPVQPYLTVRANNLFGASDQFELTTLISPVPKEEYFVQGAASVALNNNGLRISSTTSFAKTRSDLLPRTMNLSSTQVRSDLKTSYPLVKSVNELAMISGGIYYSYLRYDLNHANLAKDRIIAAYVEMSDTRKISPTLSGNFFARGTLGRAIPHDRGTATSRANTRKGFGKVTAGAAFAWEPLDRVSIIARAEGQITGAPLNAGEEISFGAERFGRGYASGMVSGDYGAGLSLQPQYAFIRSGDWNLTGFLFADYAYVKNTRGDMQFNDTLVSAGTGFSLAYGNYSVSLSVAKPFDKVRGRAMRLQPRVFGTLQIKL